ncbi:TPA: recombinase family protein, partial [Aeromonas hydrophila]
MLPAYIYSRISSKQQTSGVGLDRQLENAKAYCQANNLEIVDIQADVASAFHSKHIDGNLGAFLDAIKGNLIPVPSALVVESLDRLGREHELTALSRFIDIVKAGVEIHEISTGIVYNIADTHLLHVALSIMTRAYNESSIKSKRATDAIQRKIEDARKTNKVIGANIPAWIDNIDGKFHLNKHAETVKRIYDLYISGMTIRPIVRYLIEQNVEYPVPKIAKKGVNAGTYQWHSGRIMTILSSSCVYGTYTPKNGEPIEDYYPAVVDL